MNAPSLTSSMVFSVCMPIYNGRKWLSDALESLRHQSHSNWELIIIEDASPEPSRDIVETFATSVKQKVTYKVNSTNLGCSRTREQAISLASHDYIAPLDQDDVWKPEHLSTVAGKFAETDSLFVFTSSLTFYDDITHTGAEFSPAPEDLDRLRLAYSYAKYWIQPSSIAFQKKLLDKVGSWSKGIEAKPVTLPGSRDMAEDRNFFLRVFHHKVEPVWTRSATNYYRQHPDSMTGKEKYTLLHRAWFLNYYGIVPGFPRIEQWLYLSQANANAGRILRGSPEHRKWCAYFYFRSWLWNPLRIDRLFQLLRSFLGTQ